MAALEADLPFVDEHTITSTASPDEVWVALRSYVDALLRSAERNPLGRVLGTEPRSGFEVVRAVEPERLDLAGRHRFSRYRLSFTLDAVPEGRTLLHARTYATFPGVRGRAYRALVIGTGAHALVTRRMLRQVRRGLPQ